MTIKRFYKIAIVYDEKTDEYRVCVNGVTSGFFKNPFADIYLTSEFITNAIYSICLSDVEQRTVTHYSIKMLENESYCYLYEQYHCFTVSLTL